MRNLVCGMSDYEISYLSGLKIVLDTGLKPSARLFVRRECQHTTEEMSGITQTIFSLRAKKVARPISA